MLKVRICLETPAADSEGSGPAFQWERVYSETFVRSIDDHREIGSTNDRALRIASEESREWPALVVAERQTAGRGRGANSWWSSDGALLFSLLLEPAQFGGTPDRWGVRSLLTALAVRDALAPLVPRADCGVKWPNDVFVNRRKVAGILIESVSRGRPSCVIGIGVNVNNSLNRAPADLQGTATALCDVAGHELDLTGTLVSILQSIEQRLSVSSAHSPPLSDLWQPHCVLSNRTVRLDSGGQQIIGVCQGIDDEGALLVQTESGLSRCHAGTVVAVDGLRSTGVYPP